MDVKGFIAAIRKTRPVYARGLENIERLIKKWRKGDTWIKVQTCCPYLQTRRPEDVFPQGLQDQTREWVENVWVHYGCNPYLDMKSMKKRYRPSYVSHEHMVRGGFQGREPEYPEQT